MAQTPENNSDQSPVSRTLRQRAEEMARTSPTDIAGMTSADVQRLVHDLQIHQMELELQNEELRRAQIELAESLDRYSDLYEFAPVGYLTVDEHGRILEANLTAATMLGVERQDLLRARISNLVARESQDACYLHLQAVFASETKQVCEWEMKRPHGLPLAVRLESIAFRTENDRCCRTALSDVTNVRQAQRQLRDSEERYRRLTEAVTDYIYHVRVEHGRAVETVHGANCTAITGYAPDEFEADRMLWIAMVPPEDRDMVERQAASMLSGQDTPPVEHRICRKDGQVRWVLNTVSPQYDSQGKLVAYDGLLRDVTERKQAEQALRELNEELEQRVDARTADLRRRTDQLAQQSAELEQREREFRTLADNVPALFSYLDLEQRYRYVNRRYEELFQRPAAEIVGKTPADLVGPRQFAVAKPHIDAALRGEEVTYETELELADGRYTMHVTYVPDLDDQGHAHGFYTLATDITSLKKAEQQAQLLAEAISHLGEGVVITEDELDWPGPRIVFVNEAMCRITGYSSDELTGKTPRILQGKDTSREILDHIRHELSAGRSCKFELINYRKDASPYHAEIFITPLFDSKGRRTSFVSIHRDITERKRAEEALRDREERIRAILNTAADAIITIDLHGIIVAVNHATQRMFGYTEYELIGQNVRILMPPPYCDDHDSYITRYLETGEARIIGIGREVMARRKDGSTFPVDLAVSEVQLLSLFTGLIRDISDRKELQKEVLEIAEQEDRRIGHELHEGIQQEVTALELFAGTLRETLEKAEPREIDGKATRLLDETRFLRIQQTARKLCKGLAETHGHVQRLGRGIMPVQIDAHGLNSALAELACSTDELQNVSCYFHSTQAIQFVDNITATHLYRIAQEAVNNALRHSRGDTIGISLARQNDLLILQVNDNGIGIDPAVSSQAAVPGSLKGIGLRAMHYRAGLIGATLHVARRAEGGTVVRCTLGTVGNDE